MATDINVTEPDEQSSDYLAHLEAPAAPTAPQNTNVVQGIKVVTSTSKKGRPYTILTINFIGGYDFETLVTNEQAYVLKQIVK